MPTYNQSPTARRGTTPYGLVPGNIDTPDPYADLGALYPNLSGTDSQISSNIMAHLKGELTPETRAAIQDDAARYGVSSGMPGSDLAFRRGLVRQAGAREALMGQGLNEFGAASTNIRQNQILDPTLRSTIASHNADLNAAPDPQLNVEAIQALFDRNSRAPTGRGGGSVQYAPNSGGRPAPMRVNNEAEFGNLVARGTGVEDRPYTGGYNSGLPRGFSFGGSGDLIDYTGGAGVAGPEELGPWFGESMAEPGIGYNPEQQYGQNFSGPVDYGTQFQNLFEGTGIPDGGGYDPSVEYGPEYDQPIDFGTEAWY